MSAGRFKDMADCMNQLGTKYPDPNIRRQVCIRLMGESSSTGSNTANKKPNPFQKK